ncbi:SDR family NAD(P)-dependent oxidoreductase [Arthrobacter sp. STN4]|uniref:SDR family NAD(P)-dependent oxidoreductase n=1 Tax=Arthrobacter sp. STN4 TaxID=2923276 RepID=UPI00211A585A|nr:SDR family oxidoreductase [Arthrobacter sp. STN4]MCQ9164015.1 SDR family oxidoreductase [Arthrobacter sp. STN4]
MDLLVNNRVILVVGGTGLVGSAVVEQLRSEGATVIVASRRGSGGITLDAGDDASVSKAIAHVLQEHGRIDGLVVAAAPPAQSLDPARSSEPNQVLSAVDGKAMAFLRVASAVIPSMRESGFGRIVVVSGQNAFITGNITGSVRNAATTIIAKNLADELAGSGVTVNSVSPAVVTVTPSATVAPGRGGDSTPQQIADLVAFLISPLSGVSGESIAVGHRMLGATLI